MFHFAEAILEGRSRLATAEEGLIRDANPGASYENARMK